MTRNYPLLILLTLVVTTAGASMSLFAFYPHGLPFNSDFVDEHTAVISAEPGIALPSTLRSGDRIELTKLDRAARISLLQANPLSGDRYDFVIERARSSVTVPVMTVDLRHGSLWGWSIWSWLSFMVLTTAIGLLLLWRGRDRAALGMAIWTISYLVGYALQYFPAAGMLGLGLYVLAWALFLNARIGFYIMIEAVVGPGMSPRSRTTFRWIFLLVLLAGACIIPGGMLIYVFAGWSGLLLNVYGWVFGSSYLVPIVMLAMGYASAEASQRLRLRWMLMSSLLFLAGIYVGDTSGIGIALVASIVLQLLGFMGFVYTVLRHRVVGISVIIDRTLVYAGVTALVVGVVAAANSLVLRLALPPGAGLLLQVVVPLSLGIVLGRVRTLLDRVVEQVFFRAKYLSEKALRTFSQRAGHIDQAADLLEATVREVFRHTSTPAVAIYSVESDGFRRLRQTGQEVYPAQIGNNDAAAVALRAERRAVDLQGQASALGEEGCVFPMLVLGNLRGLMVVKNRVGEHFGPDEMALLTRVAQEVGAAWRILRARDNEALVAAMAAGMLQPDKAFAEARKLALGWAGS